MSRQLPQCGTKGRGEREPTTREEMKQRKSGTTVICSSGCKSAGSGPWESRCSSASCCPYRLRPILNGSVAPSEISTLRIFSWPHWPALFSAPVAYHRLIFRRHRKRQLLRIANMFAVAGLACVGLDISGSVLPAMSYVEHGIIVPSVAIITLLTFAFLWFAMPLAGRREPNR
jgi:Family of unknown function (DUF6328)